MSTPAEIMAPVLRADIGEAQAKINAATEAIRRILIRIQRDKDVAYLVGAGTQVYHDLTAAYAQMTGEDVNAVRNAVIPGSAAMHRGGES